MRDTEKECGYNLESKNNVPYFFFLKIKQKISNNNCVTEKDFYTGQENNRLTNNNVKNDGRRNTFFFLNYLQLAVHFQFPQPGLIVAMKSSDMFQTCAHHMTLLSQLVPGHEAKHRGTPTNF